MWVHRPHLRGLIALWTGFARGANDPGFDAFCLWVNTSRYPAPGDHPNPQTVDGILRGEVTGSCGAS